MQLLLVAPRYIPGSCFLQFLKDAGCQPAVNNIVCQVAKILRALDGIARVIEVPQLTGAYSRVAEAIPSTRRMSFVNHLSREKQIEIIAAL
jgi:hypothetical protein